MIALTQAAAGAGEPSSAWQSADMDRSCPGCTDFYRYANGGWLAPPAHTRRTLLLEQV
ncbi:MAG: hypothetical protein V4513_04075 [Pseudomonadota bacterium]